MRFFLCFSPTAYPCVQAFSDANHLALVQYRIIFRVEPFPFDLVVGGVLRLDTPADADVVPAAPVPVGVLHANSPFHHLAHLVETVSIVDGRASCSI